MLQIKSPNETIAASQEKVYDILSKFSEKNLEGVPGISNFKSLENGCSFTIQNGINCRLLLCENVPFSKVSYRAETDKNISADVSFSINYIDDSQTSLSGILNANVPFFLQGMAKGIIEKYMGTIMQMLKNIIERS